mgnify:CR=1 FL=1
MKRILFTFLLLLIAILGKAQYGNYVQLTAVELLQYQLQKTRKQSAVAPFARYGLRRIRASKYLEDSDPRHIWGLRLHPNEQYIATEPLYKLFQRDDLSSIAIIDTQGGSIEVVFWDKNYYRRFAQQLRNIGFVVSNSNAATNVLQFRKSDTTVHVDVTIWPDVYILKEE